MDFEALQQNLQDQWRLIGGYGHEEQTMVVVPSMSIDWQGPSALHQAFEERFLFLLLLLRKPRARMVYVTSQPVLPQIVDYYLSLLPGVIPSHARARLEMVPVHDGSPRPLTQKLLERPRLLERLRGLAGDRGRAHLVPFNATDLERDLAVALGIPMYAADPKHLPLGTKSGSRRLFEEVGVPHPAGFTGLQGGEDLVAALSRLRASRPDAAEAVVKLDEGVSGGGNARIDLRGLPGGGTLEERHGLIERVRDLRPEDPKLDRPAFLKLLAEMGGVVEERIMGAEVRSPSVQMRVTPLGELEVLSTHDQILGGRSGQSYMGCRFPADPAYAIAIVREARKIGLRLAKEGVLGRFAVDFVVTRSDDGSWQPYAIELNLRKGGTTHPYLTLEFLTGGSYAADEGVFRTPDGTPKYYVASDHVTDPAFRDLTADDLFAAAVTTGLHFDGSTATGIVFHMISAVTELGRFGMTAVGDSPEQAQALYDRAVESLTAMAR